jgi:hypothetical protein
MILQVSQHKIVASPGGGGAKIKTFSHCLLFTLKTEAVGFFDILLNLYQTIRRHIPEEIALHTCCHENPHLHIVPPIINLINFLLHVQKWEA